MRARIPLIVAAFVGVWSPAWSAEPSAPWRLEITAREDARDSDEELHAFLADPRAEVRARAALALGRIGRPADVPILAAHANDAVPEVRREVVFALGEVEDTTAAAPLVAATDPNIEGDSETRALAVEALGKIRRGAEACERALKDPSARVRWAALLAAWQIPAPDAFPRVLELSASDDVEARWRAAYCLMRFMGAPASGRTPIPGGISLTEERRAAALARLSALTADTDPRVRIHAARGIRSVVATEVREALLRLARDADWRVRVEAVRSLAGQGPAIAEIDPFLRDPHPLVRIAAVEALSALPDTAGYLDAIAPFLSDPRPRFREVAFSSLVRRAPESDLIQRDAVRLVPAFATSKDWTLRIAAIEGHALLDATRERALLEAALGDDPRVAKEAVEPYLRLRARLGEGPLLGRFAPELDQIAAEPDPVLRAVLVGSLGAVAADSSVKATPADWAAIAEMAGRMNRISRARDRQNDVRLAVVELAAGRITEPPFRAILDGALDDPNFIVRREAARALERAGEHPRAPEPVETGRAAADYAPILAWAEKDHWAVIETEGGRVVARLFGSDAPLTCWNFARLAESGAYDRGAWHRVVPDFVLQDGCPRGDGSGGPDWQIRCEINRRRYVEGALGMALSGKDTGGSQFFFTHSDQPHLDGRYTVFGQIESGQEVADRIVQGSPIFSIRVVDAKP